MGIRMLAIYGNIPGLLLAGWLIPRLELSADGCSVWRGGPDTDCRYRLALAQATVAARCGG